MFLWCPKVLLQYFRGFCCGFVRGGSLHIAVSFALVVVVTFVVVVHLFGVTSLQLVGRVFEAGCVYSNTLLGYLLKCM